MEWTQVMTITTVLLGGIFYIHNDIREIRQDIKTQSGRIDKLYTVFVDLLKDKKHGD